MKRIKKANTNIKIAHRTTVRNTLRKNLPKIYIKKIPKSPFRTASTLVKVG